jgi:hypothetical protein
MGASHLCQDPPPHLHANSPCAVFAARGCARLLRNCEVHIAPRPRRPAVTGSGAGEGEEPAPPPPLPLRMVVPRRAPGVRDPMRRCRILGSLGQEQATGLAVAVHPCVLRRLLGGGCTGNVHAPLPLPPSPSLSLPLPSSPSPSPSHPPGSARSTPSLAFGAARRPHPPPPIPSNPMGHACDTHACLAPHPLPHHSTPPTTCYCQLPSFDRHVKRVQ